MCASTPALASRDGGTTLEFWAWYTACYCCFVLSTSQGYLVLLSFPLAGRAVGGTSHRYWRQTRRNGPCMGRRCFFLYFLFVFVPFCFFSLSGSFMGKESKSPVFWRLYGSYTAFANGRDTAWRNISRRQRRHQLRCLYTSCVVSLHRRLHSIEDRHCTNGVGPGPHYSEEKTRNARAQGKRTGKRLWEAKAQARTEKKSTKKSSCWKEEFCYTLGTFFSKKAAPGRASYYTTGFRSGMHGRAGGWAQNASLREYCMVGWRLGGKPRL